MVIEEIQQDNSALEQALLVAQIEEQKRLEIQRELRGLLPTVEATPRMFRKCNRCAYAFHMHPGGVIDMRDVRAHKALCVAPPIELFPDSATSSLPPTFPVNEAYPHERYDTSGEFSINKSAIKGRGRSSDN